MTGSNRGELQRALRAANLPTAWERSILDDGERHQQPGDEMNYQVEWLSRQIAGLRRTALGQVPIFSSLDELRNKAAEIAGEVVRRWTNDARDVPEANAYVRDLGFGWPGLARAQCEKWWRRTLLVDLHKRTEDTARHLAQVGGRNAAYVSNETHRRFLACKRANIGMMDAAEVLCLNDGEKMRLADCVKTSVSNPKIRHAEMMTRVRGMEDVALSLGHVGLFWTWTLPTSHHPIRADGSRNARWSGVTARESANNLIDKYADVRKALQRDDISVYGLRVMEPHKSGTPHGHMLMWCAPEHRERVLMTVATVFMRDLESLPGYLDHELKNIMVKCEEIDAAKGSAVAYVAKYISKNISDDFELNDKKMGVSRVLAWASAHRIKQFQFSGGPTIGSWRECRRVPIHEVELDEVLTDAMACVHRGAPDDEGATETADFGQFIRVNGGMFCKRKDRPMRVEMRASTEPNGYGEYFRPRVAGLRVPRFLVETRKRRWRVEFGRGGSVSRTRFNNYPVSTGSDTSFGVVNVLVKPQLRPECNGKSKETSGLKACAPITRVVIQSFLGSIPIGADFPHPWEAMRSEIERLDNQLTP